MIPPRGQSAAIDRSLSFDLGVDSDSHCVLPRRPERELRLARHFTVGEIAVGEEFGQVGHDRRIADEPATKFVRPIASSA